MNEAVNFENSMKRLDEIVQRLESGKLSLEESIALYKEGSVLAESCKNTLDAAKLSVENAQD